VQPGAQPRLGAYPARIARDGVDGDLRFAIVPAQTYPTPGRTLEQRRDAIAVTYAGRFEEAVDLTRQTVGEDAFFDGILKTMSQGILGLPQSWQGDPEMCSALDDADGTRGDFAAMHPIEECSKIFEDGLLLGIGLGQYLLKCWRCGYTDHDRVQSINGGAIYEVCQRCDGVRVDRPAGMRELFELQWRDPRWLWQNTVSFRWYVTHRQGLAPFVDGDGEWFMFRTVPGLDAWRHGPWIAATLGAIFSRDAQYDAQNTSSVCAPTPVLRCKGPSSPEARREAEQRIERLMFDNRMVLDGEWLFEIISASADYKEICETIVNRCSDGFETQLTGNIMGRSARSAFTDASVYNRTTRERRAFYAGAWARQIREKGLVHWARRNYGVGADRCPVLSYDVRSPEDKLAASTAMKAEGDALLSLATGAQAVGVELDQAWIVERLQRLGIRARPKATRSTALTLGVDAIAAVVKGDEARASQGLPPFGDERGEQTIAVLTAPPSEGATTAPPAADVEPTPSAIGARIEEPEEDGGEDADAARLAAEYTTHALDRCPYHGRTHSCPRCGVRRVYGLDAATGAPRVAWRPIRHAVAA